MRKPTQALLRYAVDFFLFSIVFILFPQHLCFPAPIIDTKNLKSSVKEVLCCLILKIFLALHFWELCFLLPIPKISALIPKSNTLTKQMALQKRLTNMDRHFSQYFNLKIWFSPQDSSMYLQNSENSEILKKTY